MAQPKEYAVALAAIVGLTNEETENLSKASNEVLAKIFEFYIEASKRMTTENTVLRSEIDYLMKPRGRKNV